MKTLLITLCGIIIAIIIGILLFPLIIMINLVQTIRWDVIKEIYEEWFSK